MKTPSLKSLALALSALAARHGGETLLLCSHGGPCAHAYRGLLGARARTKLVAGYTALYVFVRQAEGGGGWDAPVAADVSHLDEALKMYDRALEHAGPDQKPNVTRNRARCVQEMAAWSCTAGRPPAPCPPRPAV